MSFPQKLKDPRTCRVFVSSPFGGIEKEREELVARYFPQLSALCQAKGVQFVAVDMRWGITEEAANDNQVVNICLREIDRSDIFVGIYGQRYGWHGAKDESFQRNVDLAVKRYPWLKSVRDRSVTEFEYMHGHLNKPGALPTAFAFRAKAYDDEVLAAAKKANDVTTERKYEAESGEAAKLLAALKGRVVKTKAKCLAIHENYKTPEEAAKALFENMKSHMEKVLLKDTQAQSARDLELAFHDAYMATRTSLYVGGQAYMKQLDQTLQIGGCGHLVVGPSGCGKGALVSNWMENIRKKKSHELIYHFVGSSKDSTSVSAIMLRLTEELERVAGVIRKKKGLEDRKEEDSKPTDLSEMFQQLEVALDKAAKKKKVLIVIDGVARIEQQSRTSKTLFWLPKNLPSKAVTIVVTCREDNADVIDELKQRGYTVTTMSPLTEQQKKEFCVGFLQQSSKELSPSQLKTIMDAKQSENPFFLKIVISELCSFGNFRLLDSKIASLMKATSVAELFEQFLIRLEEDYNGNCSKSNCLIQKVMCGLTLARKGLTETEIKDILQVPSASWSPIYFAIKDFIVDHSGILRLAFQELVQAVEKRYMSTKADKEVYLGPMIDYFQKRRREIPVTTDMENPIIGRVAQELTWLLRAQGDKEAMVEVLTDITIFARMFLDEEYELMELWRSTGRSAEQIVRLYLAAIDKRRAALVEYTSKQSTIPVIDLFVLSYLDALTYFLELNHYTAGAQVVLNKRLEILEKAAGENFNEDRRQRMLSMVKVKLGYMYADVGNFKQGEKLLMEVLDYRTKLVENAKGADVAFFKKDLAGCYHAIGLLSSKMGNMGKALEFYKKAMVLHGELDHPVEFADSMNNVGVMLMKQGEYAQAAELCSKALKIYEDEYFGHLPPVIGVMIGNIAVCYRNLKKMDESEKMYKKALDITERALGHNHPNVAVALTNLGTLEVNRERYETAEKYFNDALSIHKACLTPATNDDYFKTKEKYIFTLVKLDKKTEAVNAFMDMYEQATKGELLGRIWPTVWYEMLSLLMAAGQIPVVAKVSMSLLTAGAQPDIIATFLDRADRAMKKNEKRPPEFSVKHLLEKNPGSQMLLAYYVQEVLIPDGNTAELLPVLDKSEAALKAGPDLYHAAMSWCEGKGKKDMAFEVLKHAANKYPDNMNFVAQLGSKLRESEKFEEALPYVMRLVSTKGDDVDVLLFAGELVLQMGDTEKASEIFKKASTVAKPGSRQHEQVMSGLKIVEMMKTRKVSLPNMQAGVPPSQAKK